MTVMILLSTAFLFLDMHDLSINQLCFISAAQFAILLDLVELPKSSLAQKGSKNLLVV